MLRTIASLLLALTLSGCDELLNPVPEDPCDPILRDPIAIQGFGDVDSQQTISNRVQDDVRGRLCASSRLNGM